MVYATAGEKIKAGEPVYFDSDSLVRSSCQVTISMKANTFKLDKAFIRAKHNLAKLKWLCWSFRGWRRCLRPFIKFHFWWTKPI